MATGPSRDLAADYCGRHRVGQPRADTGDHPLSLSGQHDPQPLANRPSNTPTAVTVESPVLSNGHAGFGERPGETDRWQHWNRAPGRLNRQRRQGIVAGGSRWDRLARGRGHGRGVVLGMSDEHGPQPPVALVLGELRALPPQTTGRPQSRNSAAFGGSRPGCEATGRPLQRPCPDHCHSPGAPVWQWVRVLAGVPFREFVWVVRGDFLDFGVGCLVPWRSGEGRWGYPLSGALVGG